MRAVVTRTVFALAVLLAAGLSWPQLAEHLRWQGYALFADELEQGRFEPGDLALLGPALARAAPGAAPAHCSTLRETPLLTLNIHAADLLAWEAQADPLLPSADPALTAQRQATRRLVERGLACRPTDGDLWLMLALLSRALDDPPGQTARYLALSAQHAPHEGWIARRRDLLF